MRQDIMMSDGADNIQIMGQRGSYNYNTPFKSI